MSPFGWLYDRVMRWSVHPKATWYLGGVSFAESSFFPIPPDVMLAPMTLATPNRWLRLVFITTAGSVIGGLFGYFIGYFGIDAVTPFLQKWGYMESLERARSWFAEYGFWAIFIAGFSPIPYKVFTIAAGATGMLLPVFALASVIGRGARFLLVAGMVRAGGPALERNLRKHVDVLGILATVLVIALVWYLKSH